MEIRPLNNYVIVEKEEAKERRTAGGIIIPESLVEKHLPKRKILYKSLKCEQVDTGEMVLISPHAETEFQIDGKTFSAIDERNLICVIKE